jgi:hypothetical protein
LVVWPISKSPEKQINRSFARANVEISRGGCGVSISEPVRIMYVRTMYRLLRRLGPFFGLTERGVWNPSENTPLERELGNKLGLLSNSSRL